MFIRPATVEDYKHFPAIEDDASQAFCLAGLDFMKDMPATPETYYHALPDRSRVFVATGAAEPMGFIVIIPVDDQAYIKEMSVRHSFSGQGIGSKLMLAAMTWAKETEFDSVVLTTFRDVIFNGPFYRKLGFVEFTPSDKSELALIRRNEQVAGLECLPRIAMRFSLSDA